MSHTDPHPLAGLTVKIRSGVKDNREMVVGGALYRVEDWWDRVSGKPWRASAAGHNPAALQYLARTSCAGVVPRDDEVLYGKIDGIGHLVHVTELDDGAA